MRLRTALLILVTISAFAAAINLNGQLNISGSPPLPVAIGGTATSTQFTAGSIVWAGPNGVYSQDNTNLFWDSGNHRLAINNAAAASYPLDVGGIMRSSDSLRVENNGFPRTLLRNTGATSGSQMWDFVASGNNYIWRALSDNEGASTTWFTATRTGGTQTVTQALFGTQLAANSFGSGTDCVSSASPAVCSAAPTGSVTIAAAATTKQVNTTVVTANSEILLVNDSSLGTKLSVTCNTQSSLVLGTPRVTARTAGSNFTISIDAGPTTNPMCINYFIIN